MSLYMAYDALSSNVVGEFNDLRKRRNLKFLHHHFVFKWKLTHFNAEKNECCSGCRCTVYRYSIDLNNKARFYGFIMPFVVLQ